MKRKAYDSRFKKGNCSTLIIVPSNGKTSKTIRIKSPIAKISALCMIIATLLISQVLLVGYFVRENNDLNQQLIQATHDTKSQYNALNRYILRQAELLEEKSEELEVIIDSQSYISNNLISLSKTLENMTEIYASGISSEVQPASINENNIDSFLDQVTELSVFLDEISELSENSSSSLLNFNAAKDNLNVFLNRIPTLWPTDATRISSPFGMRYHPVLRVYRIHQGIDIAAGLGKDIYASASGTVITSGYDSGYGYYVHIDHGEGISTLYAHASRLLVNSGERVEKGDTIARVGSTGISSGPHLHFEVRINNTPVDPLLFIGDQ